MSIAARFNGMLYLTVALGVMVFLTADDRPILLLIALPALMTGYLTSRHQRALRPLTLPRLLINLAVMCVIVHAALRAGAAKTEDIVSILGQFLTFVQLIKLFDRRTPRDEAQILSLSVFLIIAAILTSNSLLVGVLLLLYAPVCICAAMLWQLRAGSAEIPGRPGAPPPELSRRASTGIIRLATSSLAAMVAVASVVFLFTPRGLGSDFLGRFGMARERQVGFTDEIRLGKAGLINDNPTPVLDLLVTTGDGENIGSSQQIYYLRGVTRDRYDPVLMAWQASESAHDARAEPTDPYKRRPLDRRYGAEPARGPSIRIQRITLRSEPVGGTLFALWRPVAFTADRGLTLVRSPAALTLSRSLGDAPHLTYTVESVVSDPGSPDESPGNPLGFQSGPVHDLARQVIAVLPPSREPQPRALATAIRDYLRTNYSYTTDILPPREGQDAIEFFLLDGKRGHCEYFASAMAAMCQAVGVHARIVAGYVASEFNSLTGQYLVRESNAHAWVEVYVGDGRWLTLDPTPPADVERIHRPSRGVFSQVRAWYDAIEFGWSTSVIGFDTLQQTRLFGSTPASGTRASRAFDSAANSVASWMKTVARDRHALGLTVQWALLIVLVGYGLHRVILAIRTGRGPRRRRSGGDDRELESLLREAGFYTSAVQALARAGRDKPRSRPPLSFASDLARSDAAAGQHFASIARIYYTLRFGRRPLSGTDRVQAEESLRNLESRLDIIRKSPGSAVR